MTKDATLLRRGSVAHQFAGHQRKSIDSCNSIFKQIKKKEDFSTHIVNVYLYYNYWLIIDYR